MNRIHRTDRVRNPSAQGLILTYPEIRQESVFLTRSDRVIRSVNPHLDIRGTRIVTWALSCLDHGGIISRHRRKPFCDQVPDALFDFIEEEVRDCAQGEGGGGGDSS